MSSLKVTYNGQHNTSIVHLDSGVVIQTDAPKDNHGLGQSFSPTDLLCTSLISCILTIISISLKKHNINLIGTSAIIHKRMKNNPRVISVISADITFPKNYSIKIKKIIKNSIKNCPVHKSLSKEITTNINIIYS